ncbi:hypothetical protein POV26_00340 [Aequorivita todarodis]|uniref:hypothetical protein n=1 Tax=Aequorivita todarodis TaxID=2036821 RepID=UPI00234FFB21|nr:hypothetical protein [Aequorivita todarodis]MDC7999476.1 hypothetical protein [Aequorivita todarodis]
MNWRWYIPVLIIALAFFGISKEKSTLPNQEIIVQFDANSVSAAEAQHAVSEITSQLKAIGVAHVQVSELLDGKLKVTYYSTIDVAAIKNLFYNQNKLNLDGTAFNTKDNSSKTPFGSDANTYKLDVVKIQKDYGSDMGFHGLTVELKSAKDQYLNQIVSLATNGTNFGLKQNFERVAFKNYRNVSLLIDTTSHKIPEVRAGPLS